MRVKEIDPSPDSDTFSSPSPPPPPLVVLTLHHVSGQRKERRGLRRRSELAYACRRARVVGASCGLVNGDAALVFAVAVQMRWSEAFMGLAQGVLSLQ